MISIYDNGSKKEDKFILRQGIQSLKIEHPNIEIRYKESDINTGFAYANNHFISLDLKDKKINHICLLNSDIIATDGWLDAMISKNMDICAPVTNAAGNEQTVLVPYTINKQYENCLCVKEYSSMRKEVFDGLCMKTDFVTFFCVLIKKEVFLDIGLLDERFYPGGYEDDDFCERANLAGYKIGIARDCFVHHFGSSSFNKVNNRKRHSINSRNKRKFEKKHKHIWNNRKYKLLLSCYDDLSYLNDLINKRELEVEKYGYFSNLILKQMDNIVVLEKDWCETLEIFYKRYNNIFQYYFDKIAWKKN